MIVFFLFFTFSYSIMNLLEIIEEHLGADDLWPSSILTYLFIDRPSPVRSDRLKKVIAFFYGNDVPQALACRLYDACNATASRFVAEQFQEWYYVWRTERCKPHMAEYWNMPLGRFIYINGSLLNQSEPVSFKLSKAESFEVSKEGVAFGIDNAGFP